jgi:hypothetical protein
MRRTLKERFKAHLAHRRLLRFHMGLILSATAASGVGISKLLLMAGLTRLSVRYGISVLLSYLVFLGLIRLWIWFATGRGVAFPDLDAPGVVDESIELPAGDSAGRTVQFGGGSSGGGGASSSWDGGPSLPDIDLDIGGGDDGIGLLIALAVLVAAILLCGGFLLYVAPDLLAEAAFSALLAGSLRRATRRLEAGNWTLGVLKYTFIPFVIVCGLSIWLGAAAQRHCPSAVKLRQAIACADSATSPVRD